MRLDRKHKIMVANSAILLVSLAAMVLMIRPMVRTARDSATLESCFGAMGDLSQAIGMYLADHDDKYPPADSWMDAVGSSIDSSHKTSYFRCPEIARGGKDDQFGYAFNKQLSGRIGSTIGDVLTPLVFDSSDLSFNANGTLDLLPNPPRHMGNIMATVDLVVRRHSKVRTAVNKQPKD